MNSIQPLLQRVLDLYHNCTWIDTAWTIEFQEMHSQLMNLSLMEVCTFLQNLYTATNELVQEHTMVEVTHTDRCIHPLDCMLMTSATIVQEKVWDAAEGIERKFGNTEGALDRLYALVETLPLTAQAVIYNTLEENQYPLGQFLLAYIATDKKIDIAPMATSN